MQSLRLSAAIGSIAIAFGLGSNNAQAAGSPAGTNINNTAEVAYTVGTVSSTTTSNTSTIKVAEILDVTVNLQSGQVPVAAGDLAKTLVFLVTNTGNGPETFHLAMTSVLTGDEFDPLAASPSIYLDSDGVPGLSAGDAPYVAGSNDPVLNADGAITVIIVNNIPATVADGNRGFSRLSADARTGVGAAGTTYAGMGVDGTDAVVGTTGADGEATGTYLVAGITVSALKSQTVVDQYGGARPIPGARINYTIVVSATGTGSAAAAVFADNIPANTTYVPGTLRLNTTVLSDAADADVGAFIATPAPRVSVQLGTVTQASGSQTIQFAVTIN